MKGIPAVLLLVACAIVVLSSFLTWIQFRPELPPGFESEAMSAELREMMVATGWQGDVSLLGFTLPNWIVPALAIGIIGMTLMRGAEVWEAPHALSITFAGYCVAHLGLLIFVVVTVGSRARLGLGAPICLLASLGALAVTIFGRSTGSGDEPVRLESSRFEVHGGPRRCPMPDDVPEPPDFSPRPRQRI